MQLPVISSQSISAKEATAVVSRRISFTPLASVTFWVAKPKVLLLAVRGKGATGLTNKPLMLSWLVKPELALLLE